MKCHIIKDLLPNHIDGLNNEETSIEIKKHLDECEDCRDTLEKMTAAIPQIKTDDKEINFLKKLKAKMLRRNIIVAVTTCIVLLGGLIIFAMNYQIPIPFDPNRMSVQIIQEAVVVNEDGSVRWWDLNLIYPPEGFSFTSDDDIPTQYEYIRDTLYISWQGFSRISTWSVGREINRDGENIRVVFYIHTKTPWTSLFFDYDLTREQSRGRTTGTQIYGDRFQTAHQEPQKIEIFYLPIRNFGRLFNLSDEDFDAMRFYGYLLWSGMN